MMDNSKKVFRRSVWVLVLCISLLVGTTFAWFTDNTSSMNNMIKAGNLDMEMYWTDDLAKKEWHNIEDEEYNTVFNYENWEPGYTEVRYIKIKNAGDLAFKYTLNVTPQGDIGDLAEVIDVYYAKDFKIRAAVDNMTPVGTIAEVSKGPNLTENKLLPIGKTHEGWDSGEVVVALALKMDEEAGNEYQNLTVANGFAITTVATQVEFEEDSFGSDYDKSAEYPVVELDIKKSEQVTVDADGLTTEPVEIRTWSGVKATVPAGVKLEDGVDKLTLRVSNKAGSDSGVNVDKTEELIAYDVHIEGVSTENTTPIIIDMGEVMEPGLNLGNYEVYHVEGDKTVEMKLVGTVDELTAKNQFHYDPVTGNLTLAMATFSEVALVENTENPWNGESDTTWYDNVIAENADATEFAICNADQIAGLGKLVAGGNDFDEKSIKLINDVNMGGEELTDDNGKLYFYPIGYTKDGYQGTFSGTFDGSNHTVKNIFQNTWMLNGNYDNGYYNAAMGLFGYVYNGTVKNLTIENFQSDGEFAATGCVTAYAAGTSTFENIALTNCNPRVYNTGNGGIVGIGGSTSDDNAESKLTFNNITIDNTNKITALWGSWDVACGGLVGMYRGPGQVEMNNCHVAAQIDVYNDVCGNYQYYWYRYSGMLIGTNKNMTEKDGYTVPETDNFKASGCTVHFGEWNNYYYCELVDNSLASYTHDHQFSRLTEVKAVNGTQITNLDGTSETVPSSGKYNYVVVNGDAATENATCYHFVDGKVWKHEDAGEETVNGEKVLKEDKQHVYLPFNQIFTGYGWGVKHIPVGEFDGVKILDREVADSVKKFEVADNARTVYEPDETVTVGELFVAADLGNDAPVIDNANVQVTVSPVGEESTVAGIYSADTDDWTKGTLKFTGLGKARIIITDYNFCITTALDVTIKEPEVIDRFEIALGVDEETGEPGNFLYRVGNANNVTLASLFAEVESTNVKDETVDVTITSLDEDADVKGAFTANTTDWTKGTIKFEGTGPVKVAIKAAYANELTLNLEVVDANNYESEEISSVNGNIVLLCDTAIRENGALTLSGKTLYGNGFKIDCTKAAYSGTGSVSENYVIRLTNACLDNVEIIGKVYTEYGAQSSSDYNRALVLSKGKSTIVNCYLSNTASPIRLVEGELNVKGTTVKGGNFANIDVRNGHLIIEDVTTINQVLGADDTSVIGLGIVVYYESVDSGLTSVEINGTLKQYNHISSKDTFKHTYATLFVDQMMSDKYAALQYKEGNVTWVNAGIIAMSPNVIPDDLRENTMEYIGMNASIEGFDVGDLSNSGYVYTVKPNSESINMVPKDYKTLGQGSISPNYSFDYTTKNYVPKTDNSNEYCYYDNGKVLIAVDEGNCFEWDPFILTATKNGKTLDYTVNLNGKTYNKGEKISFDTSGNYEVKYTYYADGNYTIDEDNNIEVEQEKYTKVVNISVSLIKETTQHAKFTFADTDIETEKITVGDKTYISAKDVSATDKEWGYITVNNEKIFYPITEAQMKKNTWGNEVKVYYYVFNDTVTIEDYADGGTGSALTYDSETTTMPLNLTVVNGMEAKYTDISSACVDISKLTKDGPSGEVWDFSASTTVSGTTTYNGYLAHSSPSGLSIKSGTRDYDAITVAQFSYTDAAGATYYYFVGYFMPNQVSSNGGGTSPCVTPDTLVTLADGSKKEIQDVTYDDKLLVWDFYKGEYASMPPAIIFNHGYDNNNVIKLKFADGTEVKAVNLHQFFDNTVNDYVDISATTVADYVGHDFVKQSANGYSAVELVDYEISEEYEAAYGIISAGHYNIFVEGMLSTDFMLQDKPVFNYFEISNNLMFDTEQMQADIEKYGVYTYEDFADYLTPEQFEAFNVKYMKVAVGKGNFTYEGILDLINCYLYEGNDVVDRYAQQTELLNPGFVGKEEIAQLVKAHF